MQNPYCSKCAHVHKEAEKELTNFPQKGDNLKVSLKNSKYPQADYAYCLKIKEEYPTLWSKGGNIRGPEAFEYWGKALSGDLTQGTLDWIREREAWFARHFGDKNVPGIIAWLKWGGYGQHGESGVKKILSEEMRKIDAKRRNAYMSKYASTGLSALKSIRPALVDAAQAVYDEWDQDEDGVDEEYGSGGICDAIADKFADIISRQTSLDALTLHNPDWDHTFALAYKEGDFDTRELYRVDIPFRTYETGGVFNFKKIPDVEFDTSDILIEDWSGSWDDYFDEDGNFNEYF